MYTARRRWRIALLALIAAFAAPVGRQGFAQPAPQADALARSIVAKADAIRFPQEDFEVDITIRTTSGGDAAEVRKFRVLSKGNENTIVMTTEPAAERGQTLLMRGRDLWLFMPNLSQPVRLSLSQRLTGQVANGDLARANFVGDYTPKLLRTETLEGESYYVLELAAVDRSVTYSRVLYWVKKSNFFPYKAEFYSVSQRLLKTASYESFRVMAGRMRPTRLVMRDALRKDDLSVLDYSSMKRRELPDKIFTKDYLKRL